MGAYLWDVSRVHVRGSGSLFVIVLWVVMTENTNTKIMAYMEKGTGVETTMTYHVPHVIDLEDGTKPCWAWIPYWMDMGA